MSKHLYPQEGQVFGSLLSRLRSCGTYLCSLLNLVKIEHILFALPFAYSSAWLALGRFDAALFAWITLALLGAWNVGMGWNRIADLQIDSLNPRTADRELVTGRLRLGSVLRLIIASAGLYLYSSYRLGLPCLVLSFFVLALMLWYPYTKRFTSTCHLWLGLVLGLIPVASWMAVRGSISIPPALMGLGVTLWVAGFDIIYALQDLNFDRQLGLYSVPARFGQAKALAAARIFHLLSLALFLATGLKLGLGIAYYAGMLVIAILLWLENAAVRGGELKRVQFAFFGANALVSLCLLGAVVADVLVR